MVIRFTEDVRERISSGVSNILGVIFSEITDVNTFEDEERSLLRYSSFISSEVVFRGR